MLAWNPRYPWNAGIFGVGLSGGCYAFCTGVFIRGNRFMKLVSSTQDSNRVCSRRSNLAPLRSLRGVGLSEPEAYGLESPQLVEWSSSWLVECPPCLPWRDMPESSCNPCKPGLGQGLKGFTARNLRNMRSFYLVFPIWDALRAESEEEENWKLIWSWH